jgi:hypothetical protein
LQSIACTAALAEMNMLPNNSTFNATCTSPSKLIVTKRTLCGTTTATTYPTLSCDVVGDATTSCSDCTVDTSAAASEVTVTYQSIPLVPIPGRLTGILNLTRKAEVRITVQ